MQETHVLAPSHCSIMIHALCTTKTNPITTSLVNLKTDSFYLQILSRVSETYLALFIAQNYYHPPKNSEPSMCFKNIHQVNIVKDWIWSHQLNHYIHKTWKLEICEQFFLSRTFCGCTILSGATVTFKSFCPVNL